MPLIHFNTFLINLDNQIDFVYIFFLCHTITKVVFYFQSLYIQCFADFQCIAVQPQDKSTSNIVFFAGTFKNTSFSNYVLRSNGNKMYILLARKITLHIIVTPYVNLIYSSREGWVCKVTKLSFVS